MGTQHATHVVHLLGRHSTDEVGSIRHDEMIEAILGRDHTDETRVRTIINREFHLSVPTEMHLADSVTGLLIGNAVRAHELLLIIATEVDASHARQTWRIIPAIMIGCLNAATWCEENSTSYSADFARQLPKRLGTMLKHFIERAPATPDSAQDCCSQWAIGRFNELLVHYTSTKYKDENVRRIAIMLGVTAKTKKTVADCAAPIIRQLSHRALTFLPPGAQLSAINAELNADRVIN